MIDQLALLPDMTTDTPLPCILVEMHKRHGVTPAQVCGACLFIDRQGRPGRYWYKCGKARQTASTATDWRKHGACGLWRWADA